MFPVQICFTFWDLLLMGILSVMQICNNRTDGLDWLLKVEQAVWLLAKFNERPAHT